MTPEVAVVLVGLVAGYVGVSKLFFRQRAAQSAPEDDGPTSSRESARRPRDERTKKAWHEVLGVAPTATREEIKAAYRAQMTAYHPDKVQMMGREIRELAEAKAKEISAAYREALDALGR